MALDPRGKLEKIKGVIAEIGDGAAPDEVEEKLKSLNSVLKEEEPHFTYRVGDLAKLRQGDVLKRTDALIDIIGKYHNYFSSEEYLYFVVLTQSCDMVVSGERKLKTPYISIAPVRSLNDFVVREIGKNQTSDVEKKAQILNVKFKSKIQETIRKLFDNNLPDHFYFHEDNQVGFPSCVAHLRVSIALKAKHYPCILDAKLLELKEDFAAKLGMLLGNIYSRIGTEDWVPSYYTKKEFGEWIEETVERFCAFKSGAKIQKLKNDFKDKNIEDYTPEQILDALENIRIPTARDKFLDRIKGIFLRKEVFDSEDLAEEFLRGLDTDKTLMSYIKD